MTERDDVTDLIAARQEILDAAHISEWHTTGDDGLIVCDWEWDCPFLPEDRRGK